MAKARRVTRKKEKRRVSLSALNQARLAAILNRSEYGFGLDYDVLTYRDRVIADGGTVDSEALESLSSYMRELKSTTYYSKITTLLPPAGVSAGTVYTIIANDGTTDFDSARGHIKSRINADGFIENIAEDVMSINYE